MLIVFIDNRKKIRKKYLSKYGALATLNSMNNKIYIKLFPDKSEEKSQSLAP